MEQLVLTGEFLGRIGPVEGKGCAIASISGGACEMIADRGDDEGVPFAEFTVETTARLATILPDFAAPQNPLDVTGVVQADPGMFRDALLAIADDPGVDLIAAIFEAPTSPNAGVTAQVTGVLRSIGEAMQKAPVPGFMLSQILSPISEYGREVLADVGIPVALTGLDHGARAIGALYRWSEALRRPTTVASLRKNDARPRTECEALACLAAAGVSTIPAIVANCAADATDHARALDGPVALKILSPDIAHKTEVGGVRLGVAPEGAAAAYEAIIASVQRHAPDARVEGVIVSPMRGQGIEMLVGVTRDPVWGPMLAVGLGGIWVEALADVSLRLAPVDPAEARRMLEELRGFKLLAGFRGAPPADLVRLADTIATISQVATSFGADLEAFEVNPLFVRGDTIEALDALATWREPESDDCDDGPATPAVQQPVAVDAGGPQ
jgi:acyl-CoA synthetase (NDP forming)